MFESFFPKHIFLIFKRAYNAYQTHCMTNIAQENRPHNVDELMIVGCC